MLMGTMTNSPTRLPEDLCRFVTESRWTFAKTMPTWPHEYLVRGRVDDRLFEALVTHIRAHGYEGRFYRRPITYFAEDGLVYWTMGASIEQTTIINRCKAEDTFEARSKAGTLPEAGRSLPSSEGASV